jgi:hypothetical protein
MFRVGTFLLEQITSSIVAIFHGKPSVNAFEPACFARILSDDDQDRRKTPLKG